MLNRHASNAINLVLIYVFVALLLVSCSNNRFAELDSYLARRDEFMAKKRARIFLLNERLHDTSVAQSQLALMDSLYQEYYTFRFDSSMICLEQMRHLAEQSNDNYYKQLTNIYTLTELSTGGLFAQAHQIVTQIDTVSIDPRLKYKYYEAMFWATSYFSEYSQGTQYQREYQRLNDDMKHHLVEITADPMYTPYIPKAQIWNSYYRGILAQAEGRLNDACRYLKECLSHCQVNERLYAMDAMSLAACYKALGRDNLFMQYVQKAAISDVICPLKENFALQQLALFLHNKYPDETRRADRYISYSLEDARFYNNRLRMVQISNIMPSIIDSYQLKLSHTNGMLGCLAALFAIVALCMAVGLVFLRRSRNMVSKQRQDLANSNNRIVLIIEKLSSANNMREHQIRLFLDLCAVNIKQFDSYRALVQRKVKAKQAIDLLNYANTTALSEQEKQDFLNRFDKSFLSLYPMFVDQVNSLLDPTKPLEQKEPERLTPELRILALIRLGITESSAIATLLFYTPQTIYNYRSSVKRRAKDRQRFEEQVAVISGV